MDIPANLLPASWLWLAALVYAVLLAVALLTAPWPKLADNEGSNVYFGAIACTALIWILRAGIEPGHNYHLLGMTALCLMFEWQFALLAASLVLAIATWQGPAAGETFALNALLMGALPVLCTRILLSASQYWLPHNFFIYIFLNAFFAGALSVLLCGLAAAGLLGLAGYAGSRYLQVVPLLMFAEAFLNGLAMILLVAYRPRWVATFHDRWYLHGK
jgi:uncharacterized membrane protein